MVFGIVDARGYREKALSDLEALTADIANPSKCINAATSAYHLHEWIWRFQLKALSPIVCRGTVLRKLVDFREWLDANCPHFALIQDLSNGAKHALPVHSSGPVDGYGAGPYGIGPFGAPYLLIDLGTDREVGRYLVASEVIREAAQFLVELSEELDC